MMTIGEVIQGLEAIDDKSLHVYYNFANIFPTSVDSWRGIYEQPALGWADGGLRQDIIAPTVAELLIELKNSVNGKVYTGWKGGEYVFSKDQTLHVDNPGDFSSTEISAIEYEYHYGYVMLVTYRA